MRVWLGGIAFSKECFLPNQVKVFDTTLRDGEQTPGVALTPEEKVKIAKQLDVLGVDVIEAGFPIASSGERDATRRVACAGLRGRDMWSSADNQGRHRCSTSVQCRPNTPLHRDIRRTPRQETQADPSPSLSSDRRLNRVCKASRRKS
jgi:hypothetical protein